LSTMDVLKASEPVLKEVSELSSFDTNLGIFDKGNVTVIMRILGKSFHRSDYRIGSTAPAHTSSMGKAFLSELAEVEFDALYPMERLFQRTKKTIRTKKELKLQLTEIRKSGVSFTREEGSEGVEGIASLIRDATGKAVAAMSIHLPVFKAANAGRKQLAMLVKKGCSLASYRLGYTNNKEITRSIEDLQTWWEEKQARSIRKKA